MIKYKKSGIIISIVALVVCIIVAAICLTNKQEVLNNDDMLISIYEQTEQYLESEFNRVYTQYYEILDLEISNWNENYNEATFYYTMTFKNYDKDPDTVDYIRKEKEKGNMERYEILKKEYLEPKEASFEFKIIIENNEIELYSNAAPKGERWEAIMIDEYVPTDVNLNEWNSMKDEIVWGKLAYREYQTDNYYTQVIKDKKILEELNDYLFTYTREIKGGTACPFDATINLGTTDGKRIELQLATDSCTVFKIGEQYYEYTEDKGEDDSDEADFYKYFDKINAYMNGELIRSTLSNKIMGYNAYYKDTIEPTFITRNYYTKINNVEYCIAESFGFGKERDDISLDIDGDGIEELICNCTYGGDGHQEVYIFKRNMNTNTEIPSILIGKIDSKKVKLPELHDWGANAILTGYDKATNRFWINYSKGNEIKNEYSTVYLDLNDAMNIFTFEKFDDITSKTKGFENYLNVRNLENLKYSTTAQILLPYASEPAVYKKLEEINNQNWDDAKLKWEKIPSNIVSFNDSIFDITMKNQGYFEMIDENDLNFERNISDEKATEIIKNQYGKIFEEKFDTYMIKSNIVLYTDFASQIEKEPVILVTVKGISKTSEKDKQAVKEYWDKIDKDISQELNLDEYHWLYIYLLDTMTGKEYHINPHIEMGHIAIHQ